MNSSKSDAECTWGDGPDVLLTLEGQRFDLTVKEALWLSVRLEMAARAAQNLERTVQEHDRGTEI